MTYFGPNFKTKDVDTVVSVHLQVQHAYWMEHLKMSGTKAEDSRGDFCRQSPSCTPCTLQTLQQQVRAAPGEEASTLPVFINVCT